MRADELVEERRLAHVGPADDGHRPGAEARGRHDGTACCPASSASTDSAACCSAARRLAPSPTRGDAQLVHAALDAEDLLVRLAAHGDHGVARQRQAPALEVLLQRGLGVLGRRRLAHLSRRPAKRPRTTLAHRVEAGVEVHRAEQRLEAVGQDRGAPEAAALQLALAQQQLVAQLERLRDLEEGGLVHEPRAQARQVALGEARQALEEEDGDHAVEQAVADELEPLVVVGGVAAVGDGAAQERRIAERRARGGAAGR